MEIIKTDPARFRNITDFPYKENYLKFEHAGHQLDMHYIDEGEGETILALHGEPSWSYLYRKFIPVLKDYRFIAPDLIGFGKSDKIVSWKDYSFAMHLASLQNFIDKLDLNDISIIVQDWGGLLGLSLLGAQPERFKRVVILNTFLPIGKPMSAFFKVWQAYAKHHPSLPVGKIIQKGSHTTLSKEVIAAYDAPFPSRKHKGGAASFPALIPSKPESEGVPELKKAREVLGNWTKPSLVLFSDKDKILGKAYKLFHGLLPESDLNIRGTIHDAGHFLQEEKGEEIAGWVERFMVLDA